MTTEDELNSLLNSAEEPMLTVGDIFVAEVKLLEGGGSW
jgi:hypothetical protein